MYQKTTVLLHEFDDNVAAVLAKTVASITTGMSSFRQNNKISRGRWFKLGFGLRTGWACPRRQRQRRQWAWLRRQQASSNFRLTTSLLKRPFVSAANATSERSVSKRENRKRYGTFALRNCRAGLCSCPFNCPSPLIRELCVLEQA